MGLQETAHTGTFTTPWHWKMLHYIRRYRSLWPTYLIPFLYLSLVRRLLESITFAAYGNDVIGRVIFSRFCNSIEIYSTWATHDVVYTLRFSLCYLQGCLVLTRFMNYFTVFYQLQLLVNPLNAELNPIFCLLALLRAHHFLTLAE